MRIELTVFLKEKEKQILAFIEESEVQKYIQPKDLYDAVRAYIFRPAKRLRPAVLIMACGCLGGAEELAIPAAAGGELFHTWTLVHDDLIDNDDFRRGSPTVHRLMEEAGRTGFGLDESQAKEYGRHIAILSGDMQHAWAVNLFIDLAVKKKLDPLVVLKIISWLESYVIGSLLGGEALDVQLGISDITGGLDFSEDEVIKMLWLKTGVLYEFAGLAGAMIGKGTADFDDPEVKAVKEFTGLCGIAFQLQDDILGVLGDEKTLGKPVGSDIREGKKTTILYEALRNADENQRRTILQVLGDKNAGADEINRIIDLFKELNGVDYTKQLAAAYIKKALPCLDPIPASKYKDLLLQWADFMINRDF
ncbi:MAG: polyprenyl synthetase family protein [Firmicutes bacterium]|nr:polyprenyl synthetase family protein [Bacillota bacterium]